MPDDRTLKELYDREAWFEGGERGGYRSYDVQSASSAALTAEILNRFPDRGGDLSVLDIGCGYGTHLRLAADRQWKCFGVEMSAHARKVASQRHGDRLNLVEHVEDLIPHRYDLILMLDVIEHLKDPSSLFFTLFSKGAIGPETLVVIATPNARSAEAMVDPVSWVYRHPPSHLVYYSAKSLEVLLHRLRFREVRIYGTSPLSQLHEVRFGDEPPSVNDDLGGFAGIIGEAQGSDFAEFMRARYVPGTWSKLSEYEHVPRYLFAKGLAAGANVLDFGCGTGYGAASLAEVAGSVLGLDIEEAALQWAREMHSNPKLRFERRSDLGKGLPPNSFDLVTCFEMIEHVGLAAQIETLRIIASLLTPSGKLVISTPNPRVTANYGANPHHVREMTETEFLELLKPHFKHIFVMKQWVHPSIRITADTVPAERPTHIGSLTSGETPSPPLAYVAVCSQIPFDIPSDLCVVDTLAEVPHETIHMERKLNTLRIEKYELRERFACCAQAAEARLRQIEAQLAALENSREVKLGRLVRHEPFSLRKFGKMAYLLAAMIAPTRVKRLLYPFVRKARTWLGASKTVAPYVIRQAKCVAPERRRVVHAIANFYMGGSSRLVVDLIERLGHLYEQLVLTSAIPDAPAYAGAHVIEKRQWATVDEISECLISLRPDLVHVHYWGDLDRPWYEKVILAAERYGCPIIENINTPVEPYRSDKIARYVFVSDYARNLYACRGDRSAVVHPGSDLDLFSPRSGSPAARDTIGMVYRLEPDKLSPHSIDVFVKVAQRRPGTKAIIVGGGTYLEMYKAAVRSAGVSEQFEFAGYVPYEDLPGLYSRLAVFIAPVSRESFGQVLPFAMHMGIPVAGYDVGALAEILGSRDLLAPPGDSLALASIVVDLLEDRQRGYLIGRHNRERAAALFSVEAMADKYRTMYAEILHEAK
ncbi:MAG: methyltransferase domain-containing protein [Planctomycetes bacterium]|nr:methyltransferase domain-containing protein [Planctomycetota bacterium]